MSSYTLKATYKPSGEDMVIEALDDYYGRHQYGYRTPDGTVYNQDGFDLMFTPLPTSQEHTQTKAQWLRSEIEKLEGSMKTGNNGEGLPFENSPDIYGNARIEAWKNGHNQAITSIITRYKEELKVLESNA